MKSIQKELINVMMMEQTKDMMKDNDDDVSDFFVKLIFEKN